MAIKLVSDQKKRSEEYFNNIKETIESFKDAYESYKTQKNLFVVFNSSWVNGEPLRDDQGRSRVEMRLKIEHYWKLLLVPVLVCLNTPFVFIPKLLYIAYSCVRTVFMTAISVVSLFIEGIRALGGLFTGKVDGQFQNTGVFVTCAIASFGDALISSVDFVLKAVTFIPQVVFSTLPVGDILADNVYFYGVVVPNVGMFKASNFVMSIFEQDNTPPASTVAAQGGSVPAASPSAGQSPVLNATASTVAAQGGSVPAASPSAGQSPVLNATASTVAQEVPAANGSPTSSVNGSVSSITGADSVGLGGKQPYPANGM